MKQTSDTSFAPDWLALREPVDHAARDATLLARAGAGLVPKARVLDIGCGTGSTARAFEAAGCHDLRWQFFDQDSALLQIAAAQVSDADCLVGDIADVERLPMEGADLLTASALFDLMSETWITALILRAERFSLPIYAALSYNGVMHWQPSDPKDAEITEAFNAHQRRDKGSGPALGPDAAARFAQLATARGWQVAMADSDWQLGPEHALLQQTLVAGIAEAADEGGAQDALAWGERRGADAATSRAVIGHIDVLAIPGAAG